jgi:hypothetical protein
MSADREPVAPLLAAEVNALPERVRRHIHDLETICDPTGMVQQIASLTEQRDALLVERIGSGEAFAACEAAVLATGGSEHWNGATHDFLLRAEAALMARHGAAFVADLKTRALKEL